MLVGAPQLNGQRGNERNAIHHRSSGGGAQEDNEEFVHSQPRRRQSHPLTPGRDGPFNLRRDRRWRARSSVPAAAMPGQIASHA
jgi:hypothetical protein